MSPQEKKHLFKSALGTFSGGAALIYLAAITYCLMTGNNFAGTLLISALVVMGGLILWILKSAKF